MGIYKYWTLESNQIRLLQLLADSDDAPLSGTLATFTHISTASTVAFALDESTPTPTLFPQQPLYRALSYYWGSEPSTSKIWLTHTKTDGIKTALSIKPNLERALKKLRRDIPENGHMDIWTDAICIDQGNIPERNSQIQKMADIYSGAKEVHIWLGDEDEKSDLAMQFAKEIKDPKKFEQALSHAEARADEWLAFARLMHRKWFSRRWVVQEISLAGTAIVHCGNHSIAWDNLEEAISIFSKMEPDIRRRIRRSKAHGNPIDFLGEVEGLGATQLVEIASNMTQRTPTADRCVMEHRMSLEGLMSTMTMFETSNPFDIVYALLWLAHDVRPGAALSDINVSRTPLGSPQTMSTVNSPVENLSTASNYLSVQTALSGPDRRHSAFEALRREEGRDESLAAALEVDYNKTLFECYKDFLTHVFHRTKSLDIICRAWALEPLQSPPEGASDTWTPEEPLPTWIQILTENKVFDSNPRYPLYERVRADPLVGKPGTGPRPYNACRKQRYEGSYASFRSHERSLCVFGFALGKIRRREDAANDGVIPPGWLKAVGWTCPPCTPEQKDQVTNHKGRPNWFWRFLVAERGLDGYQPPPMRYRAACTWLLDNRVPGKTFPNHQVRFGDCPEIVKEYVNRLSAVVWNRRLVVICYGCQHDKLFGLVPEDAEAGDIVCILNGCSVPVVLRKIERSTPRAMASPVRERPVNVPILSITGSDREGEPATKRLRLTNLPTPDPSTSGSKVENTPPGTKEFDDSEETYKFIGECFVYGRMFGEGFKHRDDHGIKSRHYTLV